MFVFVFKRQLLPRLTQEIVDINPLVALHATL